MKLWLSTCASVVLVGLLGPAEVRAQRLDVVHIRGRAAVSDTQVVISCREERTGRADCSLTGRAIVSAEGAVRMERFHPADSEIEAEASLRLDQEPVRGPIELADGDVAEVEVTTHFTITTERQGLFRSLPALGLRHPVLGQGGLNHTASATVEARAFALSDGAHLDGDLRVELGDVGPVAVRQPAAAGEVVILSLSPPWEGASDEPVAHGGPVISLGGRVPLGGASDPRFLLGVAYELGLFEHLIVSASFETDFDSIFESVVVEAAAPGGFILLPSLAVGVGVVARQLGDRDADAALRLRGTLQSYAVGVTTDFDYWPATGSWTVSISGRVSL